MLKLSRTSLQWLAKSTLFILALIPLCSNAGMTPEEVKHFQETKVLVEKGDSNAQDDLGFCYYNGLGVAKDDIEAYAYLNLAGITNERARKKLAELEAKLTPDARLKGQQRTKELQKEIH